MQTVEQTGFLFKLDPRDFILGSSSPIISPIVNPSGDWTEYRPSEEKQNRPFVFDTMSCSTFSALNCIETWINFYIANNKFTAGQLEEMNKLGFLINGQFNASDRFTAIMSGTMYTGNYLQNVWNSIINDGLLPEKDFPFDPNLKTWAEYHDKTKITTEMKEKAKKIKNILEFAYEWISVTPEGQNLIPEALTKAPLHGAIPIPGRHAVEIITKNKYFDTYDPYIKKLPKVSYSLRPFVLIKTEPKQGAVIYRESYTDKEVLGSMECYKDGNTLKLKTLELPDKNNTPNQSCIPEGKYLCRYTYSPAKKKCSYQILDVPKRAGIRFDIANYFKELLGCVALGMSHKDLNKDGVIDVASSTIANRELEKFFKFKDFTLEIKKR